MRTLDQRVAPFDWGELKDATEFVQPYLTIGVFTEQILKEYNSKLELLFPNGDYDDTYDLPKWQATRVDGYPHYNTWDRRVSVKTKRNGNFISKKKENK